MNGTIFDIQRFSVHDGPGIRTTVFFKGCPLRCRWCHNPEGLSATLQLQFFEDKCIGCGGCGDRSRLTDAEKCQTGALCVCGRTVDENTLADELLRDAVFFTEGGGVTLSGGECLLQSEFAARVLEKVKSAGFHTAVDTCGCVSWGAIEETLPFCDLYLYDIKCIDPTKHREHTGVGNEKIIENLKKLDKTGKEIWVRVPVIPDFNDNEAEMEAIAELVCGLNGVSQVTLMPYHSLGESKYKTLGLTYLCDGSKKIDGEALCRFRDIFTSKGIRVV